MNTSSVEEAIHLGLPLADVATVIDIHAHGGPWHNFWIPSASPEHMLDMMARLGVTATVFAPHLSIGPDPAAGNDLAIEWSQRYPGRLLGYAVPYPHDPNRVRQELMRALDGGLVAIKLHPGTHSCPVSAPGYRIAWEVARERETFILSHTWHGSPHCDPGMFAQYAEEFPEVPILLGHSGGVPRGFRTAIAMAQQYDNVYLDTTGSYVTGAWVRRMVDAVGAERVVYGSDIPFIDPRYGLGKVGLAGLASEQLQMILGLNAKRLLSRAGAQLATSE